MGRTQYPAWGNYGTGCALCDLEASTGQDALGPIRAEAAMLLGSLGPTGQATPLVTALASQLASIAHPHSTLGAIRSAMGVLQSLGPAVRSMVEQLQALLPQSAMTGMNWPEIVGQDAMGPLRAQAAAMLSNVQRSAQASPMSRAMQQQLTVIASPGSTPAAIRSALGALRALGPGLADLVTTLQALLPQDAATGMDWPEIVGQDALGPLRAQAATMLANIQQGAQRSPMSDFLAAQLATISSTTSPLAAIRAAITAIRGQGPGLRGLADTLQALLPRDVTSGVGWGAGQSDPLASVRALAATMLANVQGAQPSAMGNLLAAQLSTIVSAASLGAVRAAIAAIRSQAPAFSGMADALQALIHP